jgi:hypothetical protein
MRFHVIKIGSIIQSALFGMNIKGGADAGSVTRADLIMSLFHLGERFRFAPFRAVFACHPVKTALPSIIARMKKKKTTTREVPGLGIGEPIG